MRKLAGFFHWKDQDRAAERFINHHGWQRENGGILCWPFSLLLEVFCWSFFQPPPPTLCQPPPPKWWVNVVPSLTALSPAFPLPMGTQFSLLLGLYCELSSHPASAQVFGSGYFFVLFPPSQIWLQKSVWSFIEVRSLICKTRMFHSFQAPKLLSCAFPSFSAIPVCPPRSFISLPSLFFFLFFLLPLHLFSPPPLLCLSVCLT